MIFRFEDLGTFVTVCVCVCVCVLNHSIPSNSSQLWTVVHQAPLSTGFSRQESWSRLSFPPPEYIPNPGIEPMSPVSPALQVDSLLLNHQGSIYHCAHFFQKSILIYYLVCLLGRILLMDGLKCTHLKVFIYIKKHCCSVAKSCLTL